MESTDVMTGTQPIEPAARPPAPDDEQGESVAEELREAIRRKLDPTG